MCIVSERNMNMSMDLQGAVLEILDYGDNYLQLESNCLAF